MTDPNTNDGMSSSQKRHGSKNQTKSKEFVKWLLCTFDASCLQHVLDVAGGKGELAARLSMCHGARVTLVDPRVADIPDVYIRTVVPRLPNKWQDRLSKRLEANPQFVHETVASRFEQFEMHFTDYTVANDERLKAAINDCTVMIGLHADSATECIVDTALAAEKPFVVVPCCVFPSFFQQRTVLEDDGVRRTVRNYEQFCEYLLQKDPRLRKSLLPFKGRNIAVWWDGK
jgi:Methyltransferase domain